jgi:hypothetical protein
MFICKFKINITPFNLIFSNSNKKKLLQKFNIIVIKLKKMVSDVLPIHSVQIIQKSLLS